MVAGLEPFSVAGHALGAADVGALDAALAAFEDEASAAAHRAEAIASLTRWEARAVADFRAELDELVALLRRAAARAGTGRECLHRAGLLWWPRG